LSELELHTAPEQIVTPRLHLRRWRAEDAAELHPILEANQAHLGDWIPRRVSSAVPVPELAERLAGFAADFAAKREWRFAIFSRDEGRLLGQADVFSRNANGRVPYDDADRAEIGYWIREDAAGNGYVTEAARALMDLARQLPRYTRIEIRCDARNTPSAAVPKRLGFSLDETIHRDGIDLQVWSLEL
jgi:RimJ/RimL family protein N-acetyltransferase